MRALVRRPSPRLAEGEVTHIDRAPIDVERALAQHRGYLELLGALGVTLVELPELPAHPDGMFVEDVLVRIDDLGVVTRPGALSRRHEIDGLVSLLPTLGLRVAAMEPPATLDGGDVLVTPRHVFVGQSTRTNAEAAKQLVRCAATREVVTVAVTGCLHLKTALTALPDGSLLTFGQHVERSTFTSRGYDVRTALEPTGADVLCVGDVVVLPADAPRTEAMLRAAGFDVRACDISELQKLECGVTCLSVLL